MSPHAYTAMRMAFAAAIVFAAASSQPLYAGESEHFFTTEIFEGRVAYATRQQVEALFKKAAANVDVSEDDLAGVVDVAVRQLANWKGEARLRGCSGQICYEVVVHKIGTGMAK